MIHAYGIEPLNGGAEPPLPGRDTDLVWGVKIPLRDGVQLNATMYRPEGTTPVPAIFTLTPYIADSYHERACYFAGHGYAFLLVDCRGRGNSQGEFDAFTHEASDGHDVVEWLAGQPWCSGNVAMWGGSYSGFNQWMTLREAPPHLRTIVPAAAAHQGIDFPFLRNIFYSYIIRWLTLVSGRTANTTLFGDQDFWIGKYHELFIDHIPFRELDRLVGNPSAQFQTWISHPQPDPHWDRLALTAEDYRNIELPILTITGHYDGDQPGAFEYYKQHMRHGLQQAVEDHYLVIGPWDHAGTRTPNNQVGGLRFGDNSLLDINNLHREWYDWTMKGGEKPEFLKDRIAYYLMGADEWKFARSLDSLSQTRKRLYLDSVNGHASSVFQSGSLVEQRPGESLPDQYVYDPLDLRYAALEGERIKNYLTDQRYALNLFGAGLVYHSEPFEEAVELTGFIQLVAWFELDVPDTDFWVRVSEIKPDGSHILLTEDLLRARYRASLREQSLAVPGAISRYRFDGFSFTSRLITKGSRLRLVIRAPNSIHLQKNYNSGGTVAEESAEDALTAHVRLHHDEQHPSYLELPLVENTATRSAPEFSRVEQQQD